MCVYVKVYVYVYVYVFTSYSLVLAATSTRYQQQLVTQMRLQVTYNRCNCTSPPGYHPNYPLGVIPHPLGGRGG